MKIVALLLLLCPGCVIGGRGELLGFPDIQAGTPSETADRAFEIVRTTERRIQAAIASKPVDHGDRAIPVTISAGVATFPSGDTLEALLRRADPAMDRAKQMGRNRVEKAV